MKRLNHKPAAALLSTALAAALLLTACGGDNAETPDRNNGGDAAQTDEYVYVPRYIPITGDLNGYVDNATFANGALYATSWGVVGTRMVEPEPVTDSDLEVMEAGDADAAAAEEPEPVEEEVWGQKLYKISLDGAATEIPYTPEQPDLPEGRNGSVSADNISVADDGTIYILERAYTWWYDAPEGMSRSDDEYYRYYRNTQDYALVTLADDGAVLSRAPLEQFSNDNSDGENGPSGGLYLQSFAVDGAGNVYIAVERNTETGMENAILVLDGNGKELFSIPMDNWVENLVRASDGGIAAAYYGDGGEVMSKIDLAAKALGEPVRVSGDLYQMTPGGGDYDFYYTSGVYFYGYDLAAGEKTKLLNWISCDVDPDGLGRAFVLEDGRVVAVDNSSYDGENSSAELVVLTKTPASSVPRKQIVTLATQSLDWDVRSGIIKFNKSNDLYRIEVLDYSEYNTEDDYSAGLTKLKTEILSGSVPDILDLNQLSVGQLAGRGILEDLYPYIDGDGELSRADLMENVLQAFETDGKLYQTVPSFNIYTAIGAPSVVGERYGWTVDEFQAALKRLREDNPEATAFSRYMTRDDILQLCLYLDMDSFVDWSTGTCSFDSEGFVKLLEFAASFPSEFDWENYEWSEEDNSYFRLMNGLQMLETTNVGDFTDLQLYNQMLGGKCACVGFPTSFGSGNMFRGGTGFAMTSACADKDAAWQFLRQFFTESYQTNNGYFYGFPTNKKAYEKKLKEAMTPEYEKDENGNYILDENGEKIEISRGGMAIGGMGGDGYSIEFHAVTQAEADQLRELIDATTKVLNYDESIYNIVQEQIAPFFDGQRSAADVAKLVQSKVSIYVNEQR